MANMPPWSYSSLTRYESCPRQYQLVYVTKAVKDPPTAHTEWGKEVHAALEQRVINATPLPMGMEQWEPLAAQVAAMPGEKRAEVRYALTRNLEPTGWWDNDAWCRGIVDLDITRDNRAVLLDWKTGKVKPDSSQLKLFTAIRFAASQQMTNITTGFIWLANNQMTLQRFQREHCSEIWQSFIVRSLRLEMAYQKDKWVPRTSGLCRGWCPAGRDNCEFWSPKR